MGDSQFPTGISETLDFIGQRIQTTFGSEEEMKRYYLQMSNHIRSPHVYYSKESEYIGLKKLNNKLKQYAVFIQALAEHKWEKGVAGIQRILSMYLMQNSIDSKERCQTNDEVSSLLQFVVFLAENSNLVRQLQGILNHHLTNVAYLLKSMSASVEQE